MKRLLPLLLLGVSLSMTGTLQAKTLHLKSTPETVHRGVLSPDLKPVLTIASGDTVVIDTVSHGGLNNADPVAFFGKDGIAPGGVLKDAVAIAKTPAPEKGFGVHVLTGPIAIQDAQPGDMLEVRILKVAPRVPYGINTAGDGGAAPGMMKGNDPRTIKYDIAKKTVNFSPTIHFPMRPFMGILAVAPKKKTSSRPPDIFGGNLDFQKLQAGATLYLPVQVPGALFVTGDPHAAMGDGEVSGNALEASMTPTLQFILHKGEGRAMTAPFAEDAQNFYVLGMDPDLDKALTNTIKETVKFLGARFGLSPADAYSLCSTGIDFGLAEAVDQNLVMYATLPKSYFSKKFPYWK
jgi:acetamidase/formamidase